MYDLKHEEHNSFILILSFMEDDTSYVEHYECYDALKRRYKTVVSECVHLFHAQKDFQSLLPSIVQ